jgi:hypothetical protein
MRPSKKFEAKAAGQKCSPEVVFSTLRTFLADNAGIGLPLGIERVIWIGSKYIRTEADVYRGRFNFAFLAELAEKEFQR